MNKIPRFVIVTAAVAVAIALSSCAPPQSKQMTIATASMGGAYYPIGTGIAEIVSKNVKGITMTAEVTGGAVENCRLVGNKEADLALTNANTAYFAYTGTETYTQKYNISAIGSLHSTVLHVIVLDKSPIRTVSDLKGKRVAVGPAGGGSIPVFKDVLAVYGLTLDDIKASYVSYEDGMTALKDGTVDAALAAAGYPTSAVMQLANTDKVRFVEISDDKMAELTKKLPYYSKVVIPAATYKTDKDGVVVGLNNVLIVNKDMDEKTAYNITKAIYDNLEALSTYHASIKQVSLSNVAQSPIPLHPGAAKYFKEKGLIK